MHYRDKLTGRFVSAATWRRSRSHGGERYKRVKVRVQRRRTTRKRGVTPNAPPSSDYGPSGPPITGPIPVEFLESADDYFESGYESDEEDEYL